MSYTTFEYSNVQADSSVNTTNPYVNLRFDVKNTGKVAADEVAQIYLLSTEEHQPIRPIQLQGFARVSLLPGESKTINAKIYTEQFGSYTNDGKRQWNIQPGEYLLMVGSSSQDIRLQETVRLEGNPVAKPLREYYFSECTVQGK